jgi:hypothetical protein
VLPSILAQPSERRQPNDVRLVPKHSPAQTILAHSVPYFCEWDNNPPKKQVLYTMRSMIDHKLYDCVIDMTLKKFQKAYAEWIQGIHIQHAFPGVPPEIREFIKTGITPQQWNDAFKEDSDDTP